MKTISELRVWLEDFNLLHAITDSDEAIWMMLEARDGEEFESQYSRAFSQVEALETSPFTNDEVSDCQAIMRLAFKKSFALLSASSGEIAAYVADDFDLLARAIRVDLKDSWFEQFFSEYKSGRFPHGKLIYSDSGCSVLS